MIRIHWKIQFILLLISLFFVGLSIKSIVEEKSFGTFLLRPFFQMIPFLISSMVFTINICWQYKKRK